jgi:hypothetical protein
MSHRNDAFKESLHPLLKVIFSFDEGRRCLEEKTSQTQRHANKAIHQQARKEKTKRHLSLSVAP